MKLREIRLCPFAGLADLRLSFDERLTVVLGNNESGKSTVFRALESVLFVRTDLTPARMNAFVRPYVPVGGGDTIAVELQFLHEGATYALRRQWGGANAGARLTLPNGSLITGEDAITARLAPVLKASEGTYRSVLMTWQSGLSQTLAALRKDGADTLNDLGDLLTAAVQATDGVSVEAFKARLQNLHAGYFDHWDPIRNGPEGGRGIQNPWRKQTGEILKAWYAKEERQEAWQSALETERKVDALNAELAMLTASSAELESSVKKDSAAVASVETRQRLAAEEQLLAEQMARFRQANAEWPVLEQVLGDLSSARAAASVKLAGLQAEKDAAALAESRKALAEQFRRVKDRSAKLEDARQTLGSTPRLPDGTLQELVRSADGIRELEAKLSAGRLKARLSVHDPMVLSSQCGVETARRGEIAAGGTMEFQADGVLRLQHEKWTLEVESGSGDYAEMIRAVESQRAALAEQLRRSGAHDEEHARRLNAAYAVALQAVEAAQRNLTDELDGRTFDELKALAGEATGVPASRSLAEVAAELAAVEGELVSIGREMDAKDKRLGELKRVYGDPDRLFDEIAGQTAQRKELERKRLALPPLPAGVTDLDAFATEHGQRVAKLEVLRQRRTEVKLVLASIHRPEESAEELESGFREAEEAFNAALHKGNVIARIKTAVAEVEAAQAGVDPYAAFRDDVGRYVSRLTGDRYKQVRMEDRLPSGVIRRDGQVLGTSILSAGTTDVLGLALRLAMGRHFLGNSDGFLVMDDPLVDMDPARQSLAAGVLAEYAHERQVIVFTCHPGHAKALGGVEERMRAEG